MTSNVTKSKTVYTMTTAKKEWLALDQKEIANANAIRAGRAVIVKKVSDAGYSDTVIASEFGISKGEVGKLIGAGIAKKAGFDISATLNAIEDKEHGASVGQLKALSKKFPKVGELELALKGMGFTDSDKVVKVKRATIKPTTATSTAKAVKDLQTIAQRAIDGKLSLDVIAETFEELLADLKASLMG